MMKINNIVYKILLIFLLINICNFSICYAKHLNNFDREVEMNDGGAGEKTESSVAGNESKGLPNLADGYQPSVTAGGATMNIISSVLGILIVLGVIVVVISIALIGFGAILGSASEKANYQQKLVGVVIAGIFMVIGSTIAKLIISIAENMV